MNFSLKNLRYNASHPGDFLRSLTGRTAIKANTPQSRAPQPAKPVMNPLARKESYLGPGQLPATPMIPAYGRVAKVGFPATFNLKPLTPTYTQVAPLPKATPDNKAIIDRMMKYYQGAFYGR